MLNKQCVFILIDIFRKQNKINKYDKWANYVICFSGWKCGFAIGRCPSEHRFFLYPYNKLYIKARERVTHNISWIYTPYFCRNLDLVGRKLVTHSGPSSFSLDLKE